MSKMATAAALVILGLGIGLWIGFNPQAHAAAQENIDRASQTLVQVRADASTWFGGLTTQESAQSSETAQGQETATDNSSGGLDLQEIWSATQRVWISLLSRISAKS